MEYRGRHRPEEFHAPQPGPKDGWQIPEVFRSLTEQQKQGIIAAYYTSVEFLDENVGRVLAALEKSGQAKNTIVVYLGDNGYLLGQHGRFEKHCGYEPALRVPLIIRYPGKVRAGVARDLTEHIDVPATITDMMGLDPLSVTHGQSLRPYLEGRRPNLRRDHIFSEYLENEEAYIGTRDWKFVFCEQRMPGTLL